MNLSAESGARLKAILTAAGQPFEFERLEPLRSGLWRWKGERTDLTLKLLDGPNAKERLRTEAALYRELCRVGAPVPSLVATDPKAVALARSWVPGTTLYERLLTSKSPGQFEALAVRKAWLRLRSALTPWNTRISSERLDAAIRMRRRELTAVAHAVADSYPQLPAVDIQALSEIVGVGEVAVLPLDASPSNIIIDDGRVTFIDLELVGLDYADWTYAKYVTAIDESGAVRSLVSAHPDDSVLDRLDAAVSLLALARTAGLWGGRRIAPASLARSIPGRTEAAERIRAELRLESNVTSDSG